MVDDAEPRESPIDESRLTVARPKRKAVGIPGVAHALQISLKQMGPVRSAETLLRVNQKTGFDCPGCAWPEADKRHVAEFCENGAKAVAEEATLRTVTSAFFAAHPVAELEVGRLRPRPAGPPHRAGAARRGATHYRPVGWDEALDIVADELRALDDPDQAIFYTSGRTSNESAFVYQPRARLRHQQPARLLQHVPRIQRLRTDRDHRHRQGTVSLRDVERAPLLIVAGQNPGTNHPRMLTALERAKRAGSTIVAVNPLPEAGLLRFENPQTVKGMIGGGTALADHFLQVRLGGDQALFQGLGKALLEAEEARGDVFDHAFIRESTDGLDGYLDELRSTPWSEIERGSGIDETRIRTIAELIAAAEGTIVCWAMGLTQHRHSVATLKDVVNVLLLTGNIGKPGAGVCPVRGHSNVQGDRTMGIFERMPDSFHDALDREFSFASPREHGTDTVAAIRSMRDGTARVFVGLGGNFARATPDSGVTEAAMRSLALTVHISTKLNRSHVVTGRRALILPTLGRTDSDVQATGEQRVTVEDSMSAVHASRGRLKPRVPRSAPRWRSSPASPSGCSPVARTRPRSTGRRCAATTV